MSCLKRSHVALVVLALLLAAVPAVAQEGEMNAEMQEMMAAWQKAMTPGEAHSHLADMAGTWTMTVTSWQSPDTEPMVASGSCERTMELGGRVLVERVATEMMGQTFEGVGQTGYNNVTGEYWSTWADNMSTGLISMTGEVEGETMVFEGETTDPIKGKMIPMRVVISHDGPDKEISEFYMAGPDGEMWKSMVIVYERS